MQDALDRAGVPAFVAPRGRDSHFRQLRHYVIRRFPGYEKPVDEPYDLGPFLIDHKISVRAFVITEERLVAEGELDRCKAQKTTMNPNDYQIVVRSAKKKGSGEVAFLSTIDGV